MSTSAKDAGCAVGAFVNGHENIPAFEKLIGTKLAVVHWYIHWFEPFPKIEIENVPMLTWEPWVEGALNSILSGKHDTYIKDFLTAAKEYGKPLLLRFAHEMNGNWYPWVGKEYKQAWAYIHNVKRELRADNVNFVWCPNNESLPSEPWNEFANYYPGDQYVDWVGLDGYNWGYDKWQAFDQVFGSAYNKLAALTNKPMMIGEFAAGEDGVHDKEAWIKDAFQKIRTKYPRLRLVCWFNINKERDWRLKKPLKCVGLCDKMLLLKSPNEENSQKD
ncbi:MAG: glycosyl hydrolase [bacterium]